MRPSEWITTGKQLKAARALAGLSQKQLAAEAGLHFSSIAYLEKQNRITAWHSPKLIAEVMARHGVEFIQTPGPGVCMKGCGFEGILGHQNARASWAISRRVLRGIS